MARIRSVHPGLCTDEAYMEMSITAKAAWPLLWTVADDRGAFDWKPKGIKAAILPADNVDMVAILQEWKALGVIRLVEIDGKPCGLVKNFCKFQSPKFPSYRYELTEDMIKFVRWTPKKAGKDASSTDGDFGSDAGDMEDQPQPTAPILPQDSGSAAVALPPGEERRGEERKKEKEERVEAAAVATPPAPRATRLPPDWQPSPDDRAFAFGLGLNVQSVAASFRDYWHAKAGKDAAKLDWSATWRNWCRKEKPPSVKPVFRNGFAELIADRHAETTDFNEILPAFLRVSHVPN